MVQSPGLQLVKKFPTFHGTQRFITALTSVCHLSLSWASPIQSIYPHPTSWRSILILSTHLSLGLPSGLFPSCFPTKTLYAPLSPPIRATCPAHLVNRQVLSGQYVLLTFTGLKLTYSLSPFPHFASYLSRYVRIFITDVLPYSTFNVNTYAA